jgi:hypothetical protein
MDREGWRKADLLGIIPEQPCADCVKCPRPGQRVRDPAYAGAPNLRADALHAPRHFRRRSARKRHQQDPPRIDPMSNEVGNPVGQCVGLARSSAGDDQQRAGLTTRPARDAVLNGPPLLRVKLGQLSDGHALRVRGGIDSAKHPRFVFCSQ